MDDDDYSWEDESNYDYSNDDVVVLDPFEVSAGPDDDWSDEEWAQFWDEYDESFFGFGEEPDDFVDTSAWSDNAIIGALNQYGAGWQKTGDDTYRNPNTGQTYNAKTGDITNPRTGKKTATNTGSTGRAATGGGSGGSSGGGGSMGGGSQSSSNKTLDKVLATVGSLLNSLTKVSNSVTQPTTLQQRQQAAAAQNRNDIDMGKIAIGGAAVIGAILLFKHSRK